VTTIGFHARRHVEPLASPGPVNPSSAPRSAIPTTSGTWIRIGTIQLRSAFRYLFVWAWVMFGVLVVVLVVGYVLLDLLGVIGSLSRALAIIFDEPLPPSGVLPALQARNVLSGAVLASALLSALWLVSSFAAVLVHNAVSVLTGGVRVRLRRPR
jgi:hypothetical protein